MEFTKNEALAVEEAVAEASDSEIRQLDDLQLALAAGGVGEVVFG
jgi:hypothetical protein